MTQISRRRETVKLGNCSLAALTTTQGNCTKWVRKESRSFAPENVKRNMVHFYK